MGSAVELTLPRPCSRPTGCVGGPLQSHLEWCTHAYTGWTECKIHAKRISSETGMRHERRDTLPRRCQTGSMSNINCNWLIYQSTEKLPIYPYSKWTSVFWTSPRFYLDLDYDSHRLWQDLSGQSRVLPLLKNVSECSDLKNLPPSWRICAH